MELRNLITFIHVTEAGSFTKAAEQLDYSQSTVSFQIKQLEDELGCLLFERINHTITLTEKGRELVSYAHQVRALTEDFKESLTRDEEIKPTLEKAIALNAPVVIDVQISPDENVLPMIPPGKTIEDIVTEM